MPPLISAKSAGKNSIFAPRMQQGKGYFHNRLLTGRQKYAIILRADMMLVWLSWQSSSLVMSRSPVRIRPQAPKKGSLRGAFFRSSCLLKCEGAYPPPRAPPCRLGSFRLCKKQSGHKLQKKTPFGVSFFFAPLQISQRIERYVYRRGQLAGRQRPRHTEIPRLVGDVVLLMGVHILGGSLAVQ